MAILINRKYSSRLECLSSILKATYNNFNEQEFIISDIKFDHNKPFNSHDFCDLKKSNFGINYCPFLDNHLNDSKCYATQSTISDTTKSKAVSATVRAWEALGFVTATSDNKFKISEKGKLLCSLDFKSEEWFKLIQKSVLSYGPINCLLLNAYIDTLNKKSFDSSKLFISYPLTEEPLELSTSSTKDSNTRTVSMLISWCLQAGLIEPEKNRNTNHILPQVYYRELINAKRLTCRKFILTDFTKEYLKSNPFIENPLTYEALNKNVGSLREKNSGTIRDLTLKYNDIVLNRRFALIYILNYIHVNSKNININTLHEILVHYYDQFFIPNSDTWDIIQTELQICSLCGLMIIIGEDNISILSEINTDVLSINAPKNLLKICDEVVSNL